MCMQNNTRFQSQDDNKICRVLISSGCHSECSLQELIWHIPNGKGYSGCHIDCVNAFNVCSRRRHGDRISDQNLFLLILLPATPQRGGKCYVCPISSRAWIAYVCAFTCPSTANEMPIACMSIRKDTWKPLQSCQSQTRPISMEPINVKRLRISISHQISFA